MTRREFNKQETIHSIETTFLDQLQNLGFDQVTVGGLSKACGIAKSTFYLYYNDKYELLESIENKHLKAIAEICYDLSDCDLDEVLTGKPLEKAVATVRYIRENAKTLRILLGKRGDTHFSYRWRQDIENSFLARFQAEKGNVRSAKIACTIFSSSLVGLYTHLLFDLSDVTEQEFSIILGNLLKFSLKDFNAFA